MSRQVFLFLLLIPFTVIGQAVLPHGRTHQLLENARHPTTIDVGRCLLHRANGEIVGCLEIDRTRSA